MLITASEVLGQSSLLQNTVRRKSRLDFLIYRKVQATSWGEPNVVVAFSTSDKVAASLFQQPDQFRREALSHNESGVRQSGDAKTSGKKLHLNGITRGQASIRFQKLWHHSLQLGIKRLNGVSLGDKAWYIVRRCNPDLRLGIPLGANEIWLVHAFMVRHC